MVTRDEYLEDLEKHRDRVDVLLYFLAGILSERGWLHDESKGMEPEIDYFREYTPKLKDLVYGSDEYKRCLEEMRPGVEHHYKHNRHHPQFFENGIEGMI